MRMIMTELIIYKPDNISLFPRLEFDIKLPPLALQREQVYCRTGLLRGSGLLLVEDITRRNKDKAGQSNSC